VIVHQDTLQVGQCRYQDVLHLLARAGMAATFTQTGGMNAAFEIVLDGGHTLLVTDAGRSRSCPEGIGYRTVGFSGRRC